MRGTGKNNMDRAGRYALKARVPGLCLEQKQAAPAQAKIDLALFAALMKVTPGHKELVANFPGVKVRDTNVQRPLARRGVEHFNVIDALMWIAAQPGVVIAENSVQIGDTCCLADKRTVGKYAAGPRHLRWQDNVRIHVYLRPEENSMTSLSD